MNYGFEAAQSWRGYSRNSYAVGAAHGNMDEAIAVLRAAADKGIGRAWLHLILDGRSSPPQGAADLLGP